MFGVGFVVAISALAAAGLFYSGLLTNAEPAWRIARCRKVETIWFADGALAGQTDQLHAGRDGLPPRQFCALVTRSAHEGGDYTMPYQRGLIGEPRHAWHYTQGWTEIDIVHADIESWWN